MKEAGDKGSTSTTGTRSRGKAVLGIIGRTAMVLAGIWLAVLIAIQIVLSPRTVDRLIDRYASEYVDGQIHIGKASMSVFRHFPNIGITLEDFDITYPSERFNEIEKKGAQGHLMHKGCSENTDTLASFRKFSVGVSIPALLSGTISVPYMRLDQPRVFAHSYADGRANWNIFLTSEETLPRKKREKASFQRYR